MGYGAWSDWVGRTHAVEDLIGPGIAHAMAATLGSTGAASLDTGAPVPHPWIWAYFLEPAERREIGPDGHPKRGGFLPPIPNPRRMWAGSRCTFENHLRVGQQARKTSTIHSIEEKNGRTGPMVFVTVLHETTANGTLVMREAQDIVYIDIPEVFSPPPGKPVPPCEHVEPYDIDPVLLFRYSALTFNGHRIHYDRPYSRDVEKYPGLVVHGPLQATLLHDFASRKYPDRTPASFAFRGVRPIFDFDDMTLNAREVDGNTAELFTANGDGAISMTATMEWAA
ncbi:MAG: MaoC family dehydratase N-terminal domain-containing protein [Pseudomonadota bacterium]